MRFEIDMERLLEIYRDYERDAVEVTRRNPEIESILKDNLRNDALFTMFCNCEIRDRALLWIIEEGRIDEVVDEIFEGVS
jgi:hypothetical protein